MNKRIFKRCLCGVLTAAMAAIALVGFSGCDGGGNVGLTVMIYAQDHEMDIYENMKNQFMEQNPEIGNVEIQRSQQDGYATNVTSALAAGTMADVFYVEPANIARYVEQGQIASLEQYLDEEQQAAIDDIWPDAVNAFRYDSATKTSETGDLYALPHDYSAFMYAYNKTLFDQKGVAYPDANEPMTWDQFRETCAKLVTDDANAPTWGCAIPTEFFFPQILYGNGGHFLSDDMRTVDWVTADGSYQQEFLDSMKFLQGLVADGLAPTPAEDAALGVYNRWCSGQIGFYPCGTWDVANFNNPEIVNFDWDLTYFPVGPNGTYTAARAGTVGYAVYANSQHVDAAVAYIEFMSTNLDGQKELATGGIQLPNLMSYANGEFSDQLKDGTVEYCDNYQVAFKYMGGEESGTSPNGIGYRNVMPEFFYTPTTAWWNGSDGFLIDFSTFLEGSVSAEDYMTNTAATCQEALDTAWEEYELAIGG